MKDFIKNLFASEPHNLVFILGGIFIVLGALGGIPLNIPVQSVEPSARIIFYAFGGICFIVALFLSFRSTKSSYSLKKYSYGIKLDTPTSPSKDSVAPVKGEHPEVGGTYRKKPPDGMLRLFVYDHHHNIFWPQHVKHIRWEKGKTGNRWYGSVRMGGNPGYEMTIIAALVPPSGQLMCNYYFEIGDYAERLKTSIDENTNGFKELYWRHFPGSLPDDFVIIGEVRVIKAQ